MASELIAAGAAAVGGIALGSILAPIVRGQLKRRESEAIREVAPAAASFVFWALTAFGLIMAIGLTSPDTLKPLPAQMVAYFPKIIIAGILLLAGNVLSTVLALTVQQTMLRATGQARPAVVKATKLVVLIATGILAVSQLGIDTTIITLTVAALVFGISASTALLVGLGGQEVARNVAAGRVLRNVIKTGDTIEVGDVAGVVLTVHPATVEIVLPSGNHVHIPHNQVLAKPFLSSPGERKPQG
ncbi:MAG: mechanosensitive ion channel domain-containing protein [Acidimicrobiia bacterium]